MIEEATLFGVPLLLDESCTGGHEPRRPMDEAKFERFYRATAGGLWAYLFRLTGDASAADDLLQKAFFNFLRTNPTLASDEHMKRYLFRAATNLAFDHFRDKKRRPVAHPGRVRAAAHPTQAIFARHDSVFREKPLGACCSARHVEESNTRISASPE